MWAASGVLMAQTDTTLMWHHLDPKTGYYGVSTEEAYTFLKEHGRKSQPIIVAIIDSGTDIEHEDLKDEKWVNTDEIAGNGVDDDKNGYADDVNGWNFIGGPNGNMNAANLEITRLYRAYKAKFGTMDAASVAPKDRAQYLQYQSYKKAFEKQYNKAKQEYDMVMRIWKLDSLVASAVGKKDYTIEDLESFESEDSFTKGMVATMAGIFNNGLTRDMLNEYHDYVVNKVEYQLNLDFNPRASIVGDEENNPMQRNYGNNSVIGERADHGTHVAGIIAATRNNNVGINGIADNVQLLIVRTVPDGDERDKDVANAIRYAVDNGAKIINMSFGKAYGTMKAAVDEAVAYAESKGVLLVHAAGNESTNVDLYPNFPNPVYASNGKQCSTWVTVGASSSHADSALVASFSNYGAKMVDVFAPGVDVYATVPNNGYKAMSGTSMAAPVFSGVAALIWSHYPNLTAQQLKKILMKSATPLKKLVVTRPVSDDEKETGKMEGKPAIKFKKMSRTGGVVNALAAAQMAEKMAK